MKKKIKKKSVGRPFKPGQSGNPKGRPVGITKEEKAFRGKRRREISERTMELLSLSQKQAQEMLKDTSNDLALWERGVLSCAAAMCNKGDVLRLKTLLEIVFGPVDPEWFKDLQERGVGMVPMFNVGASELTKLIDKIKK